MMRVKIDKINKAVIAEISKNGRCFKGVAVCSKDDEFDEDFGVKLAKAKCVLKENISQIRYHENIIKKAQNEIVKYLDVIENEKRTVSFLVDKCDKNKIEVINIISSKY